MKRYAEESNYFDTIVSPAKSQGEIVELLEAFGAESIMVVQGQSQGRYAWLVRFQWRGSSYRFAFTPLNCLNPEKERNFGGKRRIFAEQARWQMGRIAVWFVKAILTAAEAMPEALFGFMELPGTNSRGGLPFTAAEVDVSELISHVPLMPQVSLLMEGEIVEE